MYRYVLVNVPLVAHATCACTASYLSNHLFSVTVLRYVLSIELSERKAECMSVSVKSVHRMHAFYLNLLTLVTTEVVILKSTSANHHFSL